ncbi:ribonuclease inhibitor [Microbacterium sp. Yaish 1]|uniref:ribonuclease inhibitor n=1 Tax=Microbacterium sp. Yaish 1 TaxID=2025014 RepID=UPI0015C68262|nr:ribonuclease inhibitor [Microbacterium sp. Yaish 1]
MNRTPPAPVDLRIEGARVRDIPSLYAELNRVFMPDEEWILGESLDALDDLLYGGFGVLAHASSARVEWADSAVSRRALGIPLTRAYLAAKIERPDIYAAAPARAALDELDRGAGKTYFDLVLDVFAGHPEIDLVLA